MMAGILERDVNAHLLLPSSVARRLRLAAQGGYRRWVQARSAGRILIRREVTDRLSVSEP
jgi:hypothetical protein